MNGHQPVDLAITLVLFVAVRLLLAGLVAVLDSAVGNWRARRRRIA